MKKHEKIKTVFFDFDMTLVNSMPLAHASYRALLNYKKIKPTQNGFDAYIGRRISESIEKLSKNEAEKRRLIKLFLKVHETKIRNLKVYGKEILRYLKNKKIKVIILSNNAKEVIKRTCKIHDLHFNLIIADEDMRRGWEKHEEMKDTMKKLKLKKSEVFYIGDHINDIKEGKKAGIRVISVTTGVYSESQLKKYKPYKIISNLNELKQII